MKKIRITTKEDTIRGDSYYIDPVSGYTFCSIKDVDCYLESGEIGRNAFKPKYKDGSDMELEDDKFSSAGVTTKPTLSVSMGQRSSLDVIANHQQIPKPACAGEYMPTAISEHIFSQCVGDTELTSSVLSQAEGSDQRKGNVGLAESAVVPGCTDGAALEKNLPESAQTKPETKMAHNCPRKYKHKKEINLPRRASKRLAGIKVDPIPELRTRNRVAVKQLGEGEAITNEVKFPSSLPNDAAKEFDSLMGGSETNYKFDSATNKMASPMSGQGKHSYSKLFSPEKLPEKTVEEHGSDKDQECFSFLPLENLATVKEHGDKVDAKLDYSLHLPLGELLTDPCIAFAIQTLTGVTFETSNQISSELKNTEHSETLSAAEGHSKKIKGPNMGDLKETCNVLSPPEDIAIREVGAGDTEIDDKSNRNSGSSEMPLDISWMDPCIEFAVKTLTGTIPLDTDPNTENCLQQRFSSSNTQGHCEMAL